MVIAVAYLWVYRERHDGSGGAERVDARRRDLVSVRGSHAVLGLATPPQARPPLLGLDRGGGLRGGGPVGSRARPRGAAAFELAAAGSLTSTSCTPLPRKKVR